MHFFHDLSIKKMVEIFTTFILAMFVFAGSVFSQADYPESVIVNSTTVGHQDSPEIAVNSAGTVVVVFESESEPGGPDETVFTVSYDRQTFHEFFRTGPTTDTASLEAFPDNGNFLITWEQNGKVQFAIVSCKDGEETFVREPGPIKNSIFATGKRPDVAVSNDGSLFAIGWQIDDVFMQFYDAQGNELGGIISIADDLAYKQHQLSLKFAPDSTLAATWHSETSGSFDGSNRDTDIWFQRFDCKPVWAAHAPVKIFESQIRANGDLEVDGPEWFDQEYPEIDVFDDGRFVVMWQDFPYSGGGDASDGDDKGAYFRIFNQDGTPQSENIQMSEHILNFQKDADIRIRQSDKTIHFIYEDAYQAPLDKPWLAFPSYRVFDDLGNPVSESLELSNKSYGTDSRIAITESHSDVPNLVLAVWESKDIENYDGSGRSVIFKEIKSNTAIKRSALSGLQPEYFQLYQNYPNPFNSSTTIAYSLSQSAKVTLSLFNSVGQKVNTLVDEEQHMGAHTVQLDASFFASGIYMVQLSVEGQTKSIKLLSLK
jgi:hypothetical protein